MPRKITQLTYNWFQNINEGNSYEDYEIATVDLNDVIKITEHAAAGEGDKWYYDIEYKDGETLRIFNPNTVTFE